MVGHAQILPMAERDQCMEEGEIWQATLADAMVEPWISVDARDPFDAALTAALRALDKAALAARNGDRSRGLEERLPAPAPAMPFKPFRF